MKHDLRPHQISALHRLRAAIGAGRRRPMVQSPTGSGKTILAAAIVEGALQKGNRVAFLVPALELVEQTIAAFEAEGIHAIGVLQGKHERTDSSQPVQVISIPTLARRAKAAPIRSRTARELASKHGRPREKDQQQQKAGEPTGFPDVDVVVIDEAHELFAVVKRWMHEKPKLVFVGLSATPWAKGLGKWFDDLIIASTVSSLTKAGYLSTYRAFAPQRPDLAGVRVIAGDYHEGDLAVAMNKPYLTDLVVKEWQARAEGLPTLCFCVDRAHAAAVQGAFEAAGVRAGYVDGETPRSERDDVRRRFHARQLQVVVNVGVLTTGVDWDVRCIILARPTRSDMLLVQIVGRALRTAPGKDYATLIDLSGSMQDIGLPDEVGLSRLDDGKKSISERPRRLPTPCPECSHCSTTGARVAAAVIAAAPSQSRRSSSVWKPLSGLCCSTRIARGFGGACGPGCCGGLTGIGCPTNGRWPIFTASSRIGLMGSAKDLLNLRVTSASGSRPSARPTWQQRGKQQHDHRHRVLRPRRAAGYRLDRQRPARRRRQIPAT